MNNRKLAAGIISAVGALLFTIGFIIQRHEGIAVLLLAGALAAALTAGINFYNIRQKIR
ncbi:MAG: hypothetical protein FWE64_01040 [Alphaproteobacteria bacterium]|nr:hypothetical protein [Alphaproteobacteria bacterium]